jgi:16S rRNA G527 N7-methylase RsmG
MCKREFIKSIALEFKTRSGASFKLSKRQLKQFQRWLIKQNKKYKLLSNNEIQLLLVNLIVTTNEQKTI